MDALPDGARLVTHPSGLLALEVEHPTCRATLFMHGATLTSWIPEGHDDVLYLSPRSHFRRDKPIRGGVPLCFPWFGPREGRAQHGFARVSPWALRQVEALDTGVRVVLGLEGPHPDLPVPFSARYTVSLGATLQCTLAVTHDDPVALAYEDSLHAYFAVSDVRRARVLGLEGHRYLDKVTGQAVARGEPGPLTFGSETDRMYLGSSTPVLIDDVAGARKIEVTKSGAATTVVWSPGAERAHALVDLGDDAWTRMLCVEPANAQDDRVLLLPGHVHETSMLVSVRRA